MCLQMFVCFENWFPNVRKCVHMCLCKALYAVCMLYMIWMFVYMFALVSECVLYVVACVGMVYYVVEFCVGTFYGVCR